MINTADEHKLIKTRSIRAIQMLRRQCLILHSSTNALTTTANLDEVASRWQPKLYTAGLQARLSAASIVVSNNIKPKSEQTSQMSHARHRRMMSTSVREFRREQRVTFIPALISFVIFSCVNLGPNLQNILRFIVRL